MDLINIGCGSTFHPNWINIDIASPYPQVCSYDIRKKLPYQDNSFDACYTSHVLEHLQKEETHQLVGECWRILKSQGIIRVVVPDLESIVKNYLIALEKADSGEINARADYDWMLLEMYDQTVRNFSGGEMGYYLKDSQITNRDFILSRIGAEAEKFWSIQKIENKSFVQKILEKTPSWWVQKIRYSLTKYFVAAILGNNAKKAFEEGLFRDRGEIHRWMYDRYSLRQILEKSGFIDVRLCHADESRITNFSEYELDIVAGKIRKPDSLFMEGIKP